MIEKLAMVEKKKKRNGFYAVVGKVPDPSGFFTFSSLDFVTFLKKYIFITRLGFES